MVKKSVRVNRYGWSGRRDSNPRPLAWKANALPTELLPQSIVGGDGFEPPKSKTADLQSAPFGHSGIRPNKTIEEL